MSVESYARLSNDLVYAAIAVYAFAMLAYAVHAAAGRRPAERRSTGQRSTSQRSLGRRAAGQRGLVSSEAATLLTLDRPTALQAAARSGGGDTLTRPYVESGEQPPVPPTTGTAPGRPGARAGAVALSLTRLAFLLHVAAVVARGLAAQRAPWGNMYEFALAGGLVVTGAFLLVQWRYRVDFLGVVVIPVVLLDLGLAVTVLYTDAEQLLPVLRSYWLVVHVAAAIVSTGAFTIGAALSALQWSRARAEDRGEVTGWLGRLPLSGELDRLAYKVHAFVFPIWTFAIVAGAIWAENAWASYWSWDPKETWAFITWVVYAAYLHARATKGWSGTRASVVALVGYACLLFNFFGVNFWLVGFHSYAGVG